MVEITALITFGVLTLASLTFVALIARAALHATTKERELGARQQRYMFDMLVGYADPAIQQSIQYVKQVQEAQALAAQPPDPGAVAMDQSAQAQAVADAYLRKTFNGGAEPIDDNL